MGQELAGRFRTYVPATYHQKKILYIGKATAGDFDEPDAGQWAFNHMDSAFWRFATKLSKLGGGDGRSNLAWSNLFKQGVKRGVPLGKVAEAQRTESVQFLKRELIELKPDLIVLVTAGYYEEIVREAFEIREGDPETDVKKHVLEGERFSIWTRPRYGSFPPIVWVNHPERKSLDYLEAALNEAARLTSWTAISPDM